MTASTKFTAGPWSASGATIFGPDDKDGYATHVAVLAHGSECKANGQLIAAAPELLAALIAVLEGVYGARGSLDCSTEAGGYLLGDVMNDALHDAQAALAKAGAA